VQRKGALGAFGADFAGGVTGAFAADFSGDFAVDFATGLDADLPAAFAAGLAGALVDDFAGAFADALALAGGFSGDLAILNPRWQFAPNRVRGSRRIPRLPRCVKASGHQFWL
jgi:hypothetical protein